MSAAAPARAAALDLPVPSPCAQRWDEDGDGAWESVTWYLYGEDRFLEGLLIDDGDDGRVEVAIAFHHDGEGRPVRSEHDDDGDGAVDRVSDCARAHCTTNWIPVCPTSMTCAEGPHGLIEEMRAGSTRVVNDYACWSRVDGAWRYAPSGAPASPLRGR